MFRFLSQPQMEPAANGHKMFLTLLWRGGGVIVSVLSLVSLDSLVRLLWFCVSHYWMSVVWEWKLTWLTTSTMESHVKCLCKSWGLDTVVLTLLWPRLSIAGWARLQRTRCPSTTCPLCLGQRCSSQRPRHRHQWSVLTCSTRALGTSWCRPAFCTTSSPWGPRGATLESRCRG